MHTVYNMHDIVSLYCWTNYCDSLICDYISTVEPPNKGHFGDNINSAVVSFVERLSSLRRFKMYWETNFWDLDLCPL